MNIGVAWEKESKDGKKYMSCVLQSPFLPDGEIRFAMFPVTEKKSENAPDYNLVWNKAKPKTQSDDSTPPPPGDDDIPF
jgi:uncharacterized protein (DUF736 family)